MVVVARKIKRFLTGNLSAPVPCYPPLPPIDGTSEAHLLATLICIITSETYIVPEGLYDEGAGGESATRVGVAQVARALGTRKVAYHGPSSELAPATRKEPDEATFPEDLKGPESWRCLEPVPRVRRWFGTAAKSLIACPPSPHRAGSP